MKVILLQDVANVGRRFCVVDVPNGHALNKLIPNKQAEPATPENLKRVEARKARSEAEQVAASENFADVSAHIADSTQTITVEANEKGHLFKGLKSAEIAEELNSLGFAVTTEQVVLEAPIKETGEHSITLSDGEQKGSFTLSVTAK